MKPVHVRWMIGRDLRVVCEIERASFEFPWSLPDFRLCLQQENCIGCIAEDRNNDVVGYLVYEFFPNRCRILNLAVAYQNRRTGVGKALVEKLIQTLSPNKRTKILVDVRESNLGAQLFFKSMGFLATQVLHDFYRDCDEDAYEMRYQLATPALSLSDVSSKVS